MYLLEMLMNPNGCDVAAQCCDAKILAALQTITPDEWRIASARQDADWIFARNEEREQRRVALQAHMGEWDVSRSAAQKIHGWNQKIHDWNAANPYVRPVNDRLILQFESTVEHFQEQLAALRAQVDRFYASDRFGWDYKNNCEDLEFAEVLTEKELYEKMRDQSRLSLRLAQAGFLR